ncbi:MAG: DUF5333 domain-containing protein, partial [Paracoccaceae bacterium]|nr:DUF5333 domain-containing protein [Paracoccaceae bacterium]
ARILLALRKGKELEEYAMGLGYSKKEINRFIKSDVEKDRVRAAVMAYLAQNGVTEGNEETYCVLGRAEIARKSLTGQLLWSWR